MAYVMCPKHGGHGASALCRHLLDDMLAGKPLGPMAGMEVDFEGTPLGPVWFCEACAGHYSIPPEGLRLTGDDGLDRMFDAEWGVTCPVCFREAGGPDREDELFKGGTGSARDPAHVPRIDYQPPEPPSELKWQWERIKQWGVVGAVVVLLYAALFWFSGFRQ